MASVQKFQIMLDVHNSDIYQSNGEGFSTVMVSSRHNFINQVSKILKYGRFEWQVWNINSSVPELSCLVTPLRSK